MNFQQVADRLEIQDLLARYCFAIDDRDWQALDDVFSPDARIDYRQTGDAAGNLSEIKLWLPVALARFPRYQHMIATTKLDLDGDHALGRTILFNPMVHRDEAGEERTCFIGLWYRDVFLRTPAGWRITERVEEMSWTHNTPAMPPVPTLREVVD